MPNSSKGLKGSGKYHVSNKSLFKFHKHKGGKAVQTGKPICFSLCIFNLELSTIYFFLSFFFRGFLWNPSHSYIVSLSAMFQSK